MTVKLSIEIISPLTEDDRDLLAGLALMTVAIANREINQSVEVKPEDEPYAPPTCGQLEYIPYNQDGPEATGRSCVSEPGHTGRHRFRLPEQQVMVN